MAASFMPYLVMLYLVDNPTRIGSFMRGPGTPTSSHGFQGAPHGRGPERIHRNLEVLSQEDHLEIRYPPPLQLDVTNHVPRNVPAFELAAGGKLVLREAKLVAQTTHLRTNDVPGLGFHNKKQMRQIPRSILPEPFALNCVEFHAM